MMASTRSTPDTPSAIVSVPSDFADKRSSAPGVIERLTYRCYVGFDVEPSLVRYVRQPSLFKRRFLLLREFGYWLLSRLERLRRRFRPLILPVEVDGPQYAYHGLTGRVARRLLLPRFARDGYRLSGSLAEWGDRAWFETSRRTIQFNPDADPHGRGFQMVCYTFASEDSRESIDRLLSWHVNRLPVTETTTFAYDRDTDLILKSRFLRRVAASRLFTRFYFEITIVPRDLIAVDIAELTESPTLILNRAFPQLPPSLQANALSDTLVSGMESTDDSPAIHIISETADPVPSRIIFDPGYSVRASSNRDFIFGEIKGAEARGLPLDDAFVRDAARRQVAFANSTHEFPDRPNAGATQETAELMVSSLVGLYQLAADGDGRPNSRP
jgi:hypothetical protein